MFGGDFGTTGKMNRPEAECFFIEPKLTRRHGPHHHSGVKMVLNIACGLCAVYVAHAAPLAGEHPDPHSLEVAKARYYEAVKGDRSALAQASRLFAGLRNEYPDNPLIMAYAGSTQLLESSKTLAIWRKGKLAQEGLAALDAAVARVPDHPEVRFVRAASTFHLPGIFRRSTQSQEDFAWLAARAAGAVRSGSLEPRLASAALYHHGLLRSKSGDASGARAAWEEAVRVGGETPAAIDAKKKLQSLH